MPEATVPLVRSRRADIVETLHRGAAAVVDAEGNLVAYVGDPEAVYFIRSSAKPLQAAAAAETGAFDRFGYTDAQIALAAASHSGEAAHIAEIDATLSNLGLTADALICPPAYPLYERARDAMIRQSQPRSRRHHNCSGKHCAMLAAALAQGEPIDGYWRADHPHQQRIVRFLAAMGGIAPDEIALGADGCGVPNAALPLRNMALVFARLANPAALELSRRQACTRVAKAMIRYPYLVAGSERFDTVMLAAGAGRWVCKGGALGYWAAGVLPGEQAPAGLGVALKIEDGDYPAACQTALEIFNQLDLLDTEQRRRLLPWHQRPIKSGVDDTVGYSLPEFDLQMAP